MPTRTDPSPAGPGRTEAVLPATVVVTPRERWSRAGPSLDRLLSARSQPFELVYVDGGSPRATRRHLERRAREAGFRLVRSDRYLTPNEARNVGLAEVGTEYAVFLDNDVLVTDGWLDALVARADAETASFVGPTYCIGEPEATIVHAAGGEAGIAVDDGRPRLHDSHGHVHERLADAAPALEPRPCAFAEFHCMLVRSRVARDLGGFDENLLATFEHLDFCLAAHRVEGGGWHEPASIVTYVPPPPSRPSDVPYGLLRWSRAWIESDFAYFAAKWGLGPDDPGLEGHRRYLRNHRWLVVARPRAAVERALGPRWRRRFDRVVDTAVSATLVRRARRGRAVPTPKAGSAKFSL